MLSTEQSIEVGVPVSVAYNQYTQFEEFPRFMEGIKSVKQIDDTHLHWVAEVGGQTHEWDAEIVEQRADELIAWRSIDGPLNTGYVTFRPIDEGKCEITAKMEVEPQGILESLGGAVGTLDRQVKGDLERLRDYLESRGSETGAWRGTVASGEVVDSSADLGEPISSDEIDPTVTSEQKSSL